MVLDLPCEAAEVTARLLERGYAAGFPLGRYYNGMNRSLLIAVTEKRTRQEIEMLAEEMGAIVESLRSNIR
jgi:glycine dehydrogenase subunit 1